MEHKKNITRLRKNQSLSQEDVAEALNVSRQSVSLWETGQSEPSMKHMIGLSKLFNVSLDDLISNEDPSPLKDPAKMASSNMDSSYFNLKRFNEMIGWVSLIMVIIYFIQIDAYSYSMTLFVALQIVIYAFMSMVFLNINADLLKHKQAFIQFLTPMFLSLFIQGLMGLFIEL